MLLSHVTPDTAVLLAEFEGMSCDATLDSLGRIWVVYRWEDTLWTQLLDDSLLGDRFVLTTDFDGRGPRLRTANICTDQAGWVWAVWSRQDQRPVVSYNRGAGWSAPEVVCDTVSWDQRIVSDSRGRIYVQFQAGDPYTGNVLSSYRTSRPGVASEPLARLSGLTSPTILRAPDLVRFEGRVLDVQGRVVADRKALRPGVYFLKPDDSRQTRKIILTR